MSLLRPARQVASVSRLILSQAPAAMRFASSESSTPKLPNETTSTAVTPEPIHTTEILAADTISGAPTELRKRLVRIYQPTRNTMQSGSGKTERWRIDWDTLPTGGRWENPLMGWASSADYMQGTRISFRSKEDAAHFAEKQGWDYYVQPTEVKRIPPKNYAENYVYKPHTLRIMRTK